MVWQITTIHKARFKWSLGALAPVFRPSSLEHRFSAPLLSRYPGHWKYYSCPAIKALVLRLGARKSLFSPDARSFSAVPAPRTYLDLVGSMAGVSAIIIPAYRKKSQYAMHLSFPSPSSQAATRERPDTYILVGYSYTVSYIPFYASVCCALLS